MVYFLDGAKQGTSTEFGVFLDGIRQGTGGGAAPAWTPASITTLAWYDASDATTITETDGAVSQWDDKSGNARHVSQGTGANQPTWNLSDEFAFNGTTIYLQNTSPFMYANGALSIFMVATVPNIVDSFILNESNAASSSSTYSPILSVSASNGNNATISNDVGTQILSDVKDLGFNNTRVLIGQFDTGSQWTQSVGGVDQTPTAYTRTGGFAPTVFTIGALSTFNVTVGASDWDINEIVITGTLSGADRTLMESYLNTKWGL